MAERDPQSDGYAAKAHGRIDALMIAVRTVLVFVFTLDVQFTRNLLIVAACAGCAVVSYAYLTYQPFYKPTVNHMHCAACALLVWACVCLLMLELRKDPSVSAGRCRVVMPS